MSVCGPASFQLQGMYDANYDVRLMTTEMAGLV